MGHVPGQPKITSTNPGSELREYGYHPSHSSYAQLPHQYPTFSVDFPSHHPVSVTSQGPSFFYPQSNTNFQVAADDSFRLEPLDTVDGVKSISQTQRMPSQSFRLITTSSTSTSASASASPSASPSPSLSPFSSPPSAAVAVYECKGCKDHLTTQQVQTHLCTTNICRTCQKGFLNKNSLALHVRACGNVFLPKKGTLKRTRTTLLHEDGTVKTGKSKKKRLAESTHLSLASSVPWKPTKHSLGDATEHTIKYLAEKTTSLVHGTNTVPGQYSQQNTNSNATLVLASISPSFADCQLSSRKELFVDTSTNLSSPPLALSHQTLTPSSPTFSSAACISTSSPSSPSAASFDRKYVCTLEGCSAEYRSLSGFQYHQANVHGVCGTDGKAPAKYACPIVGCGKDYTTNRSLKLHIAASHENLTFPCPFCLAPYKQEHVLKAHQKKCQKKLTKAGSVRTRKNGND